MFFLYSILFFEQSRQVLREYPVNIQTRNNIEEILGRKVSRDVLQCYIDERTLPSYRKPAHSYTFIFNATNPLKTDGLVTVHRVDHYAIGKRYRMSCRPL